MLKCNMPIQQLETVHWLEANIRNAYGTIASLPRSLDITEFSAGSDEFGNHIWWQDEASTVNPYWA